MLPLLGESSLQDGAPFETMMRESRCFCPCRSICLFVVIPEGICFCLVFLPAATTNRVPHPSRLCDGWDVKPSASRLSFSQTNQRTVISTEAVHSLIVNGEVEKSASPPCTRCLVSLVAPITNLSDNLDCAMTGQI
jgi:hypothetical protein